MRAKYKVITGAFIATALLIVGCQTERFSLWKRHCESCHDGKTVLNNKTDSGIDGDIDKARSPLDCENMETTLP